MENWIGHHPVFFQGAKVEASDTLWSEFQACIKFGIDPDIMFAKDRFSRMMITGGSIADNAINNMRSYDANEEAKSRR